MCLPRGPVEVRREGLLAQIGRYQVQELLGQGGMGLVYAAYDPELDRKVAIKLMHVEEDASRVRRRQEMLLREAQALARLAHPNILAIHDVGVHDGQVFVAMEHVAGRTMGTWWQERRPGWQEVLAATVQAGRGIVAAHAAGIVHRDIKPDNLLLGDDGRVRVADFGIARFDPSAIETTTSHSGVRELATIVGPDNVVGTPAYMPPEQLEGGAVGPASDQFSFCVTLWEGLFGMRPFLGDANTMSSLIHAGAPMRPTGASEVPAWLERALRRGLAAQPDDRWPSMNALLEVLAFDSDARRARRRWRTLYATLIAVGCMVLVLGGRALQADWARRAAEHSASEQLRSLGASTARLLAEGRREDAEAQLHAFVQDPALRDTRAAIDAWLMWADTMDSRGDRAAAQAAVVEAYMALPGDDPREPAIALRIAGQFRARWQFHELAALGEQVVGRWPEQAHAPGWVQVRADAALARADFGGFLAAVDTGAAGPEREAVAPVVRALATASCPIRGDMIVQQTDWPGAAGREVLIAEREQPQASVSLRRMDAALTPVGPDMTDLSLEAEPINGLPLRRGPDGPAYLLSWTAAPTREIRLFELGEGAPRVALRWPDDAPHASAAVDLDGDGLRELYVGTATYTRKLYRVEPDAGGTWQRRPAHPPTDAIASDINALVAGDFDGDGREELAAAVGAWRAYDVRIFEAGPDGELRVAARRRFGHVRAMAALRGADGTTLLALAKDDSALSKEAWPANQPQGEAAGLHIVRRRGDTLEAVAYVPWPAQDAGPTQSHRLMVGDFDGDGLQDLAAQVATYASPFARLLLLRQRPDGSFASATLGAVTPMLAGNFDDDPADELLATVKRGDASELCVLGVAGEAVGPGPAPHVTAEVPRLADPLLERAWTRAEHLAGFGLYGDAAHALASRITLAGTEADRRALQRRTAELYEAAGQFLRAGEGFEGLAFGGDVTAALRAVANFEQAMEMQSALRVARWALRSDGLTAMQASELRAAHERLTAVEGRTARIELRFDGAMDPAWTIAEPLALRIDPVHHELIVDATADMSTIATIPIELTGEPLTFEVELDVDRADWGTQIGISIRPPNGGEPVAELAVTAGGGGGYLRRTVVFQPHIIELCAEETASPATHSSHRLRATLLSGHDRVHVEQTGSHPCEDTDTWQRPLHPGHYVLALRSTGIEGFATQQVRARIRRISVLGARLTPAAGPASPRDRIAADMVAGRWHVALAAEADAPAIDPLWHAVALAELGRTQDAIVGFAALDPAAPEIRRQLLHLLRTRPATFAVLLRAAFGPRYAALLLASLQKQGEYPDHELWAQRLVATADLEGLPVGADDQRQTRADLLAIRGKARKSVGELALAEADLAASAASTASLLAARGEQTDAALATIELQRAELAASRGLDDDAFAAAGRALYRATDSAWMAERLRMSPALEPLHTDLRWHTLLAPHL